MADLWLDISAFQGRPPSSWFVTLKEAGYTGVWVQLWGLGPTGNGPNPHAEYVLARSREAGLLTGGYVVLYPSSNAVANVNSGRNAAGGEWENQRFVAIDVEAREPLSMSTVLSARQRIIELGGRPAIYTSRYLWGLMFGSTATRYPYWQTDPLIEARYRLASGQCEPDPPDLDWSWQPFGGWQTRAMLQYGGTCPTFGVGADRNVADSSRMGYNSTEAEVDMAVEDELIQANKHLTNISVKLDSAVNLDIEMDYVVTGLKLMLDAMTTLNAEVARLRALAEAGQTVPPTLGGLHSHTEQ